MDEPSSLANAIRRIQQVRSFESNVHLRSQANAQAANSTPPSLVFSYDDADTFAAELNEFFALSEKSRLEAIAGSLPPGTYQKWLDDPSALIRSLVVQCQGRCGFHLSEQCLESLDILLYFTLGTYMHVSTTDELQQRITQHARVMLDENVLPRVKECLIDAANAFKHFWHSKQLDQSCRVSSQLNNILNIFYVLIEVCRRDEPDKIHLEHVDLIPLLFDMLLVLNDSKSHTGYPIKKIYLTLWKVILLTFGGMEQVEEEKKKLRKSLNLSTQKLDSTYTKTNLIDLSNYHYETLARFPTFVPRFSFQSLPYYTLLSHYTLNKPSPVQSPHRVELAMCKVPQPIHESFDVFLQHVYVSASDVQVAQENRDYTNKKKEKERYGRRMHMWTNPIEKLPDDNPFYTVYKTLLPNLSVYITTMLKTLLVVCPPPSNSTPPNIGIFKAINDMLATDGKEDVSSIDNAKLGLELTMTKEIIAKAVSAILLLLMKHAKARHALMFEHICQLAVDANCILLILKLLNQDMTSLLGHKDTLPFLNFTEYFFLKDLFANDAAKLNQSELNTFETICKSPSMPEIEVQKSTSSLGDPEPEQGGQNGDATAPSSPIQAQPILGCFRTTFTTINLLRILQKLTKNKSYRILRLVHFKSTGVLKKVLKITHPMLNLYTYKLIHGQIPYMGRKWRMSNMKVISGVYAHIRPSLRSRWMITEPTTLPDGKEMKLSEEEVRKETVLGEVVKAYHDRVFKEEEWEVGEYAWVTTDEDVDKMIKEEEVEVDEMWTRHYDVWMSVDVF